MTLCDVRIHINIKLQLVDYKQTETPINWPKVFHLTLKIFLTNVKVLLRHGKSE